MNIIRRLKYRYSEPYRIERGIGLSPLRTDKELKALIAFCKEELKDKSHMAFNSDRKRIYEMTIKLYEQRDTADRFHKFRPVPRMKEYYSYIDFIDDHVGWYWS